MGLDEVACSEGLKNVHTIDGMNTWLFLGGSIAIIF